MSLHTLAQHLQTAGRGDDKVLVHMTPGEVQGLQSLAMAQGGSLTINPETGLPEAGFLSNLLPTIIGAGLSIASGGALTPLMAAGITGAGYGIATGSLQKGLMAGLGAYGGAGLTGGLASAGAAANAAANAAMQTPALNVASAQMPVAAGSLTPVAGGGVEAMKFGMYGTNAAGVPQGIMSTMPPPTGFGPQNLPQAVTGGQFAAQTTAPIVRSTEATVADTGMRQAPSVLTNVGSGIKELYNDPEKLKKYISENKMNLASSFLPALLSREEVKRPEEPVYVPKEYNWNRPYNPSPLAPGSTAERTYFADGGMTVENMSQQNAMMDNQKYPMAYQNTPTYALPSERPISQNVLYPATDAGVTPYSGVASLKDGGPAKKTDTKAPTAQEKQTAKKLGVSVEQLQSLYGKTTTAPKVEEKPMVVTPLGAVSLGMAKAFGTPAALMNAIKSGAVKTEPVPGAGKDVKAPEKLPTYAEQLANVAGQIKAGTVQATNDPLSGRISSMRSGVAQKDLTPEAASKYVSNISSSLGITGVANISGNTPNEIENAFSREIQNQEAELKKIQKDPFIQSALKSNDPNLKKSAEDLINAQTADIASAKTAKDTALSDFYTQTKRTGEGIGARSYTGTKKPVAQTDTNAADFEPKTITVADVDAAFKKLGIVRKPDTSEYNRYTIGDKRPKTMQELYDQVYDYREGNKFGTTKTAPTGQKSIEAGEKESDKYQKIAYGAINPITGWDKTVKYLEPDDVKRVYEEVVGRSPTQTEIDKYIGGKKMSLQGLADVVNKLPELTQKRTFTDEDLQEQAKYYWNRELSAGELAAFRKFDTFRELRNALGSEKAYVDNLNKINKTAFTKQQIALQDPGQLRESIKSDFYLTMGRQPDNNEVDFLIEKGLISDDLKTYLMNTNEYVYRGQPGGTQYEGNLNPYTKSKEGEVAEGTTDDTTDTTDGTTVTTDGATGTTGGKKGTVTLGGKSGIVPGVTYTPLSAADLEKFKEEYREYKPSDYSSNVSSYLTSILPQNVSTQSIYTPLGATGALPEYKIEGAMPYYSPEERLGLTNLYKQFAAKAPDLSTGLSFTPNQGVIAASPFGNTTPGLITLQSAAAPNTAPISQEFSAAQAIPETKTGIASLTPEEQALLSQYQKLEQNKTGLAAGGMAMGGYAAGGFNLGDYSDGGRLLKGPGDGVSDSIPASIGNRRPARLADGEFVIPARIVSELGNGSTDAGARQLYAMMDRIQKARRRSVGKGKVAVDSQSRKLLPV